MNEEEESKSWIEKIRDREIGTELKENVIEGIKFGANWVGTKALEALPEDQQQWWHEKGWPHLQSEWEYANNRSRNMTGPLNMTGPDAFALLTSPSWAPYAIKGEILSHITRIDPTLTTIFGAGLRPKDLGISQTTTPYNPLQLKGSKPVDFKTGSNIVESIFNRPKFNQNIVKGPFANWQSQNVPFGQTSPNITKEVYDVAKRTDAQGSGDEQLDLNFEGVGDDIVPFQESARLKAERNPEGLTVKQILENNREGINKFSNPQIQRHLRMAGVNDAGIFLMENWENTAYPGATRPKPRTGAAAVQRPGVTQETFNAAKEKHWQTWLTYFSHKGLTKGDVRLHHVATLKGSLPLYDGLEIGGQEWKDLDITLQKLGVWPGHDSRNYELMTDANHNALHRYTDLTIGPSGEVFFTPERIARLKGSEAGRLEVATEYAELVNDSKRVMMSIQEQYELMNSGKPVDPELAYRVLELGMQTRKLMNETSFESPGFTQHLQGAIAKVEQDMRLEKAMRSKKGYTDLQKEAYRRYLLDSPMPYLREDFAPEFNPDLPDRFRVQSTKQQGKKLIEGLLNKELWQLELDLLYPDD